MWPWNSPTSWPRPPPSSRSASPPLTSSPWTTQHVSSRHCPPLLGQPPMTMPPTPTTPLSQSPPEHVFGHPTDHHLHWTSRQSTPTFPPQPPFPSQPSPLRMTIHRRLPLPLHKHLNFGPTLRPTIHRQRHLLLRAHSHIKGSQLALLNQFNRVYTLDFLKTLHLTLWHPRRRLPAHPNTHHQTLHPLPPRNPHPQNPLHLDDH